MSFIKQTKQVGSVSIRESGRALAISARVISESATLMLAGVVSLRCALENEMSDENKAKLQQILSEIDGKLDAIDEETKPEESKPEDQTSKG